MPILENLVITNPFSTLADLKAYDVAATGNGVIAKVIAVGSYPGGVFNWNVSSTATPDDLNVILPTGWINPGRWERTTSANHKIISTGEIDGTILEVASATRSGTVTTGSQTFSGSKTFNNQIISSVTTGNAPFSIASTTANANLNADLLDGYHAADLMEGAIWDGSVAFSVFYAARGIALLTNAITVSLKGTGHVIDNKGSDYTNLNYIYFDSGEIAKTITIANGATFVNMPNLGRSVTLNSVSNSVISVDPPSFYIGNASSIKSTSSSFQFLSYTAPSSYAIYLDGGYIDGDHNNGKVIQLGSSAVMQILISSNINSAIDPTSIYGVLGANLTMNSDNAYKMDAPAAFVNYAGTLSQLYRMAPVSLPDGTTSVTQAANDNSTKVATTAYVDTAVGGEAYFDRTLSAPYIITPHNPNDNLDMLQGYIKGGKVTFKGVINVAADFPLPVPSVKNGDMYFVASNVTDNDPTKTNTGTSFTAPIWIIWKDTAWVTTDASTFNQLGRIAVASDFPTLAAVKTEWAYAIRANVTDNDPTKTNTGLSFTAGQLIWWSGSTWTTPALSTFFNGNIEFGTQDPFRRYQIWNHMPNSVLRLGSLGGDGDVSSTTSEGIVVYGQNAQSDPMTRNEFSYLRFKPTRIGIYNGSSTVGQYTGYLFRVDTATNEFYARNNAGTKTFEVDRSIGNVKSVTYQSTATTGTSPLTIASTTVVTNLNADTVDGEHASTFMHLSGAESVTGVKTFNATTAIPVYSAAPTFTPGSNEFASIKYVDDAVGAENLWDRVGTTLSPHTANDSVNIGTGAFSGGSISLTGLAESPNPLLKLTATSTTSAALMMFEMYGSATTTDPYTTFGRIGRDQDNCIRFDSFWSDPDDTPDLTVVGIKISAYYDGLPLGNLFIDGNQQLNVDCLMAAYKSAPTFTAGSNQIPSVLYVDTGDSATIKYFGSSTVDGSWRIDGSSTDMVIQRRESGSWVTKTTITAA